MIFRCLLVLLCSISIMACSKDNNDIKVEISSDKDIAVNSEKVVISWTIENVDFGGQGTRVDITDSTGDLVKEITDPTGSIEVFIDDGTVYIVTVYLDDGRTVSDEVSINNVSFTLLQDQILSGQSTKLRWNVSGVETITIEPFGELPSQGTKDISPEEETIYVLKIPAFGDAFIEELSLGVIDPVSIEIITSKLSGTSPLEVRFSAIVSNNNMVISRYEWDFNSDERVDVSDTFGKPQTYTFRGAPGDEFSITLSAIPAQGEPITAEAVVSIEGSPPTVQVSPNITNGHVPLSVSFSVRAQDSDGIDIVKIDYDGDGVFDDEINGYSYKSLDRSFAVEYSEEGTYEAVVQVVDIHGIATIVSNKSVEVDANNPLDPVITLSLAGASQYAPLTGSLNASASLYDSDDVAKWEWDLDGDGEFETTGGADLSDTQPVTYEFVNNYYPAVKITTSTGRTAISSIWVEAKIQNLPAVIIADEYDTIDIDASSPSQFSVSLSFPAKMNVWIENLYGKKIKTIQVGQVLEIGEHQYDWDATDDQGETVPQGDYYVVASYTAYDKNFIVDLRETTGGQLSYYRRSENNPRKFNRLESPLVINYEVNDPAEVSFFWQISFGDRLMTLMEHERMGRGFYSMYWNGDYPSGLKIANNLLLMPGIVRYSLPDNVIFVKESPRIKDYQLSSTIISDPRREPISFSLTLSKESSVEIVVADMDKGVDVSARLFSDLVAGIHDLSWDGKNNEGQYLAPGDYRIGVRSVDELGNRSMFWYRTQQIQY